VAALSASLRAAQREQRRLASDNARLSDDLARARGAAEAAANAPPPAIPPELAAAVGAARAAVARARKAAQHAAERASSAEAQRDAARAEAAALQAALADALTWRREDEDGSGYYDAGPPPKTAPNTPLRNRSNAADYAASGPPERDDAAALRAALASARADAHAARAALAAQAGDIRAALALVGPLPATPGTPTPTPSATPAVGGATSAVPASALRRAESATPVRAALFPPLRPTPARQRAEAASPPASPREAPPTGGPASATPLALAEQVAALRAEMASLAVDLSAAGGAHPAAGEDEE
jgi:hypothetical protein